MTRRFSLPIAAAVAVLGGGFVLVSLLMPGLEEMHSRVLNWAVLLAALALLLGLANLFQVHWQKIREGDQRFYSTVLLAAMLATFGITLWEGSRAEIPMWIFSHIQLPIETSLMAGLAASLTLAAARLVQRRNTPLGYTFLVTLFILLLGSGPLFGQEIPFLTQRVAPTINNFLATGAMRGLLIGVALGSMLTGLRVLIGADRPYGG
ncbi:MAG: hypothetical protein KIT46_04730 [Anaerolineales bacterium]|nr:hypothetical protein [Anaerolineales bacterium]MCW5855336.1 hypothetical protein [Anaerolineales bacterium]